MRVVERSVGAEHRAGHVLAHLDRVVEVLHADLPEDRMVVGRDIARREHVRELGSEDRIDADAAGLVQPFPRHHLDVRLRTDPHHDQVARDRTSPPGDHALNATRPFEPLDVVSEDELHPVVTMDQLHHAADPRAEDPEERGSEQLDDRHLDAELSERCRDLRPDEPHPHDHDPARAESPGTDRVGVRDPPELQHPVESGPRHVQHPVPDAGRDQGRIERDAPAVAEGDGPCSRIDPLDHRPQADLDLLLLPPSGRTDEQLLRGLLATQVRLGQPRTLVRLVRFVAEHDQTAVEPGSAQRRRRGGGGERRADDHEGAVGHGRVQASTWI